MLKKRNQKGFTLIEIIAVLVILGILAAVAIPKYLDLQDQANTRALQGALAEGMSTLSMQYARISLSKGAGANTAELIAAANANPPGSTDFSYTFATGADVLVSVNWNPTKTDISAQTKNWKQP
jgi:prepilin-type N-terminal cleavage/methylation domain-containing protein